LSNRLDLGVGLAGLMMPAFTYNLARLHDDSAHQWVG
jgi:hypothetical protein